MSWRGKHCPLVGGNCPGHNETDGGCPAWLEVIHTNTVTGEEKLIKDCGLTMLPMFMVEVIKASNRGAAAIESTRNHMGDVAVKAIKDARQEALEEARELVRSYPLLIEACGPAQAPDTPNGDDRK